MGCLGAKANSLPFPGRNIGLSGPENLPALRPVGQDIGRIASGERFRAPCRAQDRQNALLITPPSTRRAAPVVADASGLHT